MNYKKCFKCGSEKIESENGYLVCKDCGFHTHKNYKDLSSNYKEEQKTEFDKFASGFPNIVQDLMIYDEEQNLYWVPIVLNIYPTGIIYPIGNSVQNWQWAYAPYKPIPLSERKNYPIKDKVNEYYEYMLDIDNEIRSDSFSTIIEKLK